MFRLPDSTICQNKYCSQPRYDPHQYCSRSCAPGGTNHRGNKLSGGNTVQGGKAIPHPHHLTQSRDVSFFPRLKRYPTSSFQCDQCGSVQAFDSSWRCTEGCSFDLCVSCFNLLPTVLVSLHPHQMVQQLSPFGSLPAWICDNCYQPSTVVGPARYHCANNCNYDLCTSCVSRLYPTLTSPPYFATTPVISTTNCFPVNTGSVFGPPVLTPVLTPVVTGVPMFGAIVGLAYGLVFKYQNRYHPVALHGVDVDVQIIDYVARTAISQHYANTDSFPVEAVYVFPLDERSAVCGFEVEIDGVITKGVVQEKQEARNTYNKAIANGDGAQLLEQKRTDVFELTVGNLLPGQHAIITIVTVADLKIDGQSISYFLPTFVAPRYHPRNEGNPVPQSLIKRVADGLHVNIFCLMTQAITAITSSTHSIVVSNQATPSTASVTLGSPTNQLDKDLVILVSTLNPHEPRVCVEVGPDRSVVTMITLAPHIELDDQLCELVFIVDCSGSMSGSKIEQARKAMQLFFRSLPADCFINIVPFGSNYSKLWPQSVKYCDATLQIASAYISGTLGGNMGGTELSAPLRDVLSAPLIPSYSRQVFVLTDGEVSNTKEVIGLAQANQATSRVFALGLGHGASHELVEGLARAGRGTADFAVDNDRLEPKVVAQLHTALQPALNEVTVEWDVPIDATVPQQQQPQQPSNVAGAFGNLLNFRKPAVPRQYYTQSPYNIPPIVSDTRFLVFCSTPPGHPAPASATIRAKTPMGDLAVHVAAKPEDQIEGEVLHKIAARATIRDLENGTSYLHAQHAGAAEIRAEIIKLGVAHGLTSTHTSYVAVQALNPQVVKQIYVGPFIPVIASPPTSSMRSAFAMPAAIPQAMSNSYGFMGSQPQQQQSMSFGASRSGHFDMLHSMPLSSARQSLSKKTAPPLPTVDLLGSFDECVTNSRSRRAVSPPAANTDAELQRYRQTTGTSPVKLPCHAHPLAQFVDISLYPQMKTFPPEYSAWNCDVCSSRHVACESFRLRCTEGCDYDLCVSCYHPSTTPPPAYAPSAPITIALSTTPPPSSKPEDQLQALISLQKSDGSFDLSHNVLKLTGLSQDVLTAFATAGHSEINVITAAAIAFMETKLANLKDDWLLVVAKARKWLRLQVADSEQLINDIASRI